MQDDIGRQGRELPAEAMRARQAEKRIRIEIADWQAIEYFGRTRADRIRRPDLDIGSQSPLRRRQLEHHLLHTSGISTGKAFVDDVADGGHGRTITRGLVDQRLGGSDHTRVSSIEYRLGVLR